MRLSLEEISHYSRNITPENVPLFLLLALHFTRTFQEMVLFLPSKYDYLSIYELEHILSLTSLTVSCVTEHVVSVFFRVKFRIRSARNEIQFKLLFNAKQFFVSFANTLVKSYNCYI